MPLFDFKCPYCGNTFEAFQKANHEGPRTEVCPRCGAEAKREWTGGASHRFTFWDGFDSCTGEYHPTKKHYEQAKERLGLVKVE